MAIRLEALRKVDSPPNSTPAAPAMRIRLEEAKKEAELRAWPSSWPSMNRFSRPAMFRIQATRMTVMSVVMAPLPRDTSLSRGS